MTRIGIFPIGYQKCDINKLCNLLNSIPSNYIFECGTRILNLGKSDLFDYAYSDTKLLGIIEPHRSQCNISVIITSVPIEDDFFTRSVNHSTIISTTHYSDELLVKSGRTIEEYLAISICQELLSF